MFIAASGKHTYRDKRLEVFSVEFITSRKFMGCFDVSEEHTACIVRIKICRFRNMFCYRSIGKL
jgi:hypothetical protein